MTKTEEFKDRIAQRLFELDGGYSEDWLTLCGSDVFHTKEEYYFKATKILEACAKARLAFLSDDQIFPDVPLKYYKWRHVWFNAQKLLMDVGWKQTKEIEI